MKKIIVFVFCLIGSFAYSQKLECSKFKNGKFAASAFPNEYSIRKDFIEDCYMDGKLQTVWSVKWLTDCKLEKICIKNFGSEYSKVEDRSVSEITYTDEECVTLSITYFNEENPNGMEFTRGLCFQKE